MADQVIAAHWSDADLVVLAGGVGADGRRLPSSGWMALRRLGWGAVAPAGVVVSDRVRRIAEEEAARALRLGSHRRAVVAALLATWPADPFARTGDEWSALRATLPEGCDTATIRNRTRQITAYLGVHGRLPAGLFELERQPTVARQVSLAAADRQQVVVDWTDGRMVRVWSQLPVCAAPGSYRDWLWHAFDVVLPPTVPTGVKVCTPTLRPRDGRVRVDLPWQTSHTPVPARGHARGLGVDWGVNTLLTATVADLDQDGCVVVDGRPLRFDATGVSAKLVRLRRLREHLRTKADHLTRLRDGRPAHAHADPALTGKLARLEAEHAAVCARIRHLNHALAWSAARWLVDHAAGAGTTVIYVENLATLEAHGRSRSLNRRLSGAVRGAVFTAVAHLAAKAGIAVVTVPARGTSSGCPCCGGVVTHVKTPDRSVAGYRWATCSCGLSLDRDHAAAQRIAARGLANQTKARRDRSGQATIRTATDTPVRRRARRATPTTTTRPARDRRKTAPTRKQTRPTGETSRLLPLRRQVPAPTEPPPGSAGKRPAGRTPQEINPTGPVRQVPHTVSTTTPRHPHRERGAALGRGFHRHVHATPTTQRDSGTGGMPRLPRST
ncbi:zinc ribbon domain-containing protein [Micromonospora sp. NPDC005806]|uniref:zinc ribbon domain-containing protein n=1 Tax=Micromonospora sp. NPDC005806 TaxID=3364234 RepID=UPI00368DD167